MTLSNDLLQQYFDGELDDVQTRRVREEIARSPSAQAALDSLESLRGLMRSAATTASNDVPSEELFARIQSGIAEKKAAGFGDAFGVIEGEGRPKPSRARPVGWVLVAAAAAAAVVMFVARPTKNGSSDLPVATHAPTVQPPPGTEVLEVDFGGNTGTVFALEGDAGEPIAVVWINDSEETL